MATRWTFAWPCLPVLDVDISTILQGRFLITTKPFLRRAEHCIGYVAEAPASALSKVCPSCWESGQLWTEVDVGKRARARNIWAEGTVVHEACSGWAWTRHTWASLSMVNQRLVGYNDLSSEQRSR